MCLSCRRIPMGANMGPPSFCLGTIPPEQGIPMPLLMSYLQNTKTAHARKDDGIGLPYCCGSCARDDITGSCPSKLAPQQARTMLSDPRRRYQHPDAAFLLVGPFGRVCKLKGSLTRSTLFMKGTQDGNSGCDRKSDLAHESAAKRRQAARCNAEDGACLHWTLKSLPLWGPGVSVV